MIYIPVTSTGSSSSSSEVVRDILTARGIPHTLEQPAPSATPQAAPAAPKPLAAAAGPSIEHPEDLGAGGAPAASIPRLWDSAEMASRDGAAPLQDGEESANLRLSDDERASINGGAAASSASHKSTAN